MMPNPIEIQVDPRWASQVNSDRLENAIRTTFQIEGILSEPGVSLVIVGDEEMTRLHEHYRNEPGTTDVLTFPYEDDGMDEEMTSYLGDIIVCYPQASRQGTEEGHSAQEELDLLAVHGTLHLLGYDDEDPVARVRMWQQQKLVLERLGMNGVAPRVD
jgi:probable rRNA maturation factor